MSDEPELTSTADVVYTDVYDARTKDGIPRESLHQGVFIWDVPNPLYFKILKHSKRPFGQPWDVITLQVRANYNLRKMLDLHKAYLTYQIWTRLTPSSDSFLQRIQWRCNQYLNDLGVISLFLINRAVMRAIMYYGDEYISDIQPVFEIKYNLY